jgi:hypothetical protein
VSKKSKPAEPQLTGARDQYLAFLGYQLGFAGQWFPALASHLWETADLGGPVPPGLRMEFERIRDVARRLSPLIPDGSGELADQVAGSAERACQGLEGAWGGAVHRRNIERREASEPEFYDWDEMLLGSPFREPVWQELEQRIETYTRALPAPLTAWVRLGASMARVFDSRSGGTHGTAAIPALQNQLAEMSREPLLAGLPLDLSRASLEEIGELHAGLWKRLAEGSVGGADRPAQAAAAQPVGNSAAPLEVPGCVQLSKEAQALALLIENPTMSMTELARRLGCNRTSLYRMKPLMKAVEVLKGGKEEVRRGQTLRDRAGDAYTDGVESRDPSEGIDD